MHKPKLEQNVRCTVLRPKWRGEVNFHTLSSWESPAPFLLPCHLGLPIEFVGKGTLSNTSWPFCLLTNLIESTPRGWWKTPNAEFKEEIDFSKLAFWWHWLNCFLFWCTEWQWGELWEIIRISHHLCVVHSHSISARASVNWGVNSANPSQF